MFDSLCKLVPDLEPDDDGWIFAMVYAIWADMTLSKWFHDQLQSTADDFVWAVEQVPKNRLLLHPETPVLGEWFAARHAYHMLHYEQTYAIPSMRQWLGGPVLDAAGVIEDAAWRFEHILAEVL